MHIVPATPEHIPAILALMREFAEFEDLLDRLEITEERMITALFGENAMAEAIVAVVNDKTVGYAVFYPLFSTFRGQRGFFLEDLYINSEYRRGGTGEMMVKHIARLAKERGFERVDLNVLDWNSPAINFYKKHGGIMDESERHFKFIDSAFQDLAS
jgi:ribosomal protein S18 acetylase RimI-like enzyme